MFASGYGKLAIKKSHRAMRFILRIIDFEFVERAVIDRNHAETGVHSLSL